MKKITKLLILIFFGFALFTLSINTVKVEAKYNAVELKDNTSTHLRLEKGNIVVDFLDERTNANTLPIGNYDMYGILNDEGQVRYYIADIFADVKYLESKLDTKVIKATIYNKNTYVFDQKEPMYLELTYYNKTDNNIYSKELQLERSDFSLLTRHAKDFILGEDEVSDRLRASMNAYSSFASATLQSNNLNEIVLMSTSTTYANANKTLAAYNYDSYTNSDYWKDVYTTSYVFNGNYNNGIYTDDNIINVVPKHLFFREGVHSYLGKEYGFSIKTVKNSIRTFLVDVFVYDIEVWKPLEYQGMYDEAAVQVAPSYQFRYDAIQKSTLPSSEWNKLYDPNLTEIVVKNQFYDAPNYYIKDIQIKITTRNLVKPNPGQTGYVARNDYGDNVIAGSLYYNGEGKSTGRNNYDLSVVKFAHDRHYNMSNSGNDPQLSGNVVLTHGNVSTLSISSPDNHDTIFQYFDYEAPYDREGGLNAKNVIYKSITSYKRTTAVLQNENPLLFGTRTANNFVKSIAIYENREREYVEESQLHVSIALDFVSDDTFYLLVFPMGQVTVLDTVEGSYYYGDYFRRPYIIGFHYGPQELNLNISYPGQTIYVGFVPVYESYYYLTTIGNLDTVMELYNLDERMFLDIDDDSGSGLNAEISIFAQKQTIYLFKIYLYNKNLTGSFKAKMNLTPLQTVYQPGVHPYSVIMECTPIRIWVSKSSTYRIHALGPLSTFVNVYTMNGDLLGISEGYGPGDNRSIDLYLEGGNYYIFTIWAWTYTPNTILYFNYQDLNP